MRTANDIKCTVNSLSKKLNRHVYSHCELLLQLNMRIAQTGVNEDQLNEKDKLLTLTFSLLKYNS